MTSMKSAQFSRSPNPPCPATVLDVQFQTNTPLPSPPLQGCRSLGVKVACPKLTPPTNFWTTGPVMFFIVSDSKKKPENVNFYKLRLTNWVPNNSPPPLAYKFLNILPDSSFPIWTPPFYLDPSPVYWYLGCLSDPPFIKPLLMFFGTGK